VEKKVSYTWFHKDKMVLLTWTHVGGVIKFGFLTLNQALRNVAVVDWGLFLLLSCGTVKTVFLT
jgi:hypothetical protein